MVDSAEEIHRADVVVDAQGRVTIPENLRRDAGIDISSALVMYVEDGRVLVEPRDRLADRLRHEEAESRRDSVGNEVPIVTPTSDRRARELNVSAAPNAVTPGE